MTAVIVLVWLAAIGWLVRREYFRPRADVVLDAALTIPPGGSFYSVRLGEEQIGTSSMTADTLADGFRLITRHDLDLPFSDRAYHLVAADEAEYTRDLRLRSFTSRLTDGGAPYVVIGTVSDDTLLTVRAGPANAPAEVTLRQPLSGPIGLPSALGFLAALRGVLEAGTGIGVRVFDPATLTLRRDSLTVLGDSLIIVADSADLDSSAGVWVPATSDTVRAFRLGHRVNGLPERLWLDPSGFVLRTETPLGATHQRSAFELVSENYRRGGAAGVANAADWPASRGAPARGSPGLARLTVLLDGLHADEATTRALTTPWQALVGDTLTTFRKARDTLPVLIEDYRLPSTARAVWAELLPGPFDGSDPRVAAQARRIVGTRARSLEALANLIAWMSENVRDDLAANPLAPRSAHLVLETRSGDASGQAALLVAMARAVGLPARPVAGLLLSGDRFHYHCWAEVWLGEWVAVDPSLGQRFADPGHLRLVVGGLARPVELAPWIGRVRPRVLAREDGS